MSLLFQPKVSHVALQYQLFQHRGASSKAQEYPTYTLQRYTDPEV